MVFNKSFKSKFSFISTTSLAVLSAFLSSPQAYAMDEPEPDPEMRRMGALFRLAECIMERAETNIPAQPKTHAIDGPVERTLRAHMNNMAMRMEQMNAQQGSVAVQPEQNEEVTLTLRPRGQQGAPNRTADAAIDVKAAALLKEKADQGNVEAQQSLADAYLHGKGVDHDYAKAFFYKTLFEGDAEAQNVQTAHDIGKFYYDRENYQKAFPYYKLAAERGHPDAQECVGRLYLNGWGVKRSKAQAFHYFQLAASQNHPDALYWLGDMYSEGIVEVTRAPCTPSYDGPYCYGSHCDIEHPIIHERTICPMDMELSIRYYTQAAIQGDAAALSQLEWLMQQGQPGALQRVELLAHLRFAQAQYYMGNYYLNVDKDKARKYFEQAASQGDFHAQSMLEKNFPGG
jgi:TPR repeat protein